jgi:molecular chaperone GrpE
MEGKESTVESSDELAKNPDVPARSAEASSGEPEAPPAEAMAAERDRLIEEKSDLTDRLRRQQADFDNFRKRAERERADVVEYANADSVRAILPVLDDFERALKAETADKTYARGMELIYQRLAETLKKLGLEPITSKGQKFDPHLHHAVDMVETNQVEDHTILEEYQPGYNFRNRPLRPAMVKVAIKKK